MTDRLRVWLGEAHVADLERARNGLRLRYTEHALRTWALNSPIVSCSLPLALRHQPAQPFFRGLLPEGAALDALAGEADVAASDTFGLLSRYGRDIAGALTLAEDAPAVDRYAVAPYEEQTLRDEVAELERRPLGVHDDSELSIAGLQNKMLLVSLPDGRWARPVHGHPSTHILKVDSPSRPGLVRAEAECLRLARSIGLSAAEAEVVTIGRQDCLISTRFDRRRDDSGIARIHLEDLAQATGREAKYESRGRGGPGWRDAAGIIDRYATRPTEQLDELLRIATFTLAIGNADAHGKNLAFIHPTPTSVALAPLYDTVPTIMWTRLRTEAAMGLDGHFSLETCDRQDVVREATSWPLPRKRAEAVVAETLDRLAEALSEGSVLPKSGSLSRTVRERVRNLRRDGPAGPAKHPLGE